VVWNVFEKTDKHDRMLMIDLLRSKSRIMRMSNYPFRLIA